MRTLRALWTLICIVPVTLIIAPIQLVALKFKWPLAKRLPVIWHRFAARMIGLKVHKSGELDQSRPLLLISNHVSWLDIVVLGSIAPACFIAKSEVASWPAFGILAKLQRTIFVERKRRNDTGRQTNVIADRLKEGDPLILFGEGTSTDGTRVLPFRSSLIGATQRTGGEMIIQPISIAYTHIHGLPTSLKDRPITGYYGDIQLPSHLWAVLKEAAFDAQVTFGTPVKVDMSSDRKKLARDLHAEVAEMTTGALLGAARGN